MWWINWETLDTPAVVLADICDTEAAALDYATELTTRGVKNVTVFEGPGPHPLEDA